eukprot:1672934-Prymnesium_polylepis.2
MVVFPARWDHATCMIDDWSVAVGGQAGQPSWCAAPLRRAIQLVANTTRGARHNAQGLSDGCNRTVSTRRRRQGGSPAPQRQRVGTARDAHGRQRTAAVTTSSWNSWMAQGLRLLGG